MGLPEQRSAVLSTAFVGLLNFLSTMRREPAVLPPQALVSTRRRRAPFGVAAVVSLLVPGGIAGGWLLISDMVHCQRQCR